MTKARNTVAVRGHGAPEYLKQIASAKRSILTNRGGAKDRAQRWWESKRLDSKTLITIVAEEKNLGRKVSESTVSKYISAFEEILADTHTPQSRESAIEVIDGRVREMFARVEELKVLAGEKDVKPPDWATETAGTLQAWFKSRMPLHSIYQSLMTAEAHIARYMEMRHRLEGLYTPVVSEEEGFRQGEKTQAEKMDMYKDLLGAGRDVEVSETVTKRAVTITDKPKKGEVIDVEG